MKQYEGIIEITKIENTGDNADQIGILSRRREILLFIASTVRREQAPSWRFEINDTSITYY